MLIHIEIVFIFSSPKRYFFLTGWKNTKITGAHTGFCGMRAPILCLFFLLHSVTAASSTSSVHACASMRQRTPSGSVSLGERCPA